jgi:hypothetical protein
LVYQGHVVFSSPGVSPNNALPGMFPYFRLQIDALQACLPEGSSYSFLDASLCTLPLVSGKRNSRPDIVLVERRRPIPLLTAYPESISAGSRSSQPEPSTSAPQWDEILMVGDAVRRNKRDAGEICMRIKEDTFTQDDLNTLERTSDRVGAQWFRRPQRHLFHFTATSTFIRFWHWRPGSITFTSPIYYREDPRPVVEFFRLWGSAERDVRGEDVANMDGEEFDWGSYTFGRPPLSRRRTDRLIAALRNFNELYGSQSPLSNAKPTVYEFNRGPIAFGTPTVDAELATNDGEEIDFEAMMPHTDADFNFCASNVHLQRNGSSYSEAKLGGHSKDSSPAKEPPSAPGVGAESLLVFDTPFYGHALLCASLISMAITQSTKFRSDSSNYRGRRAAESASTSGIDACRTGRLRRRYRSWYVLWAAVIFPQDEMQRASN